MGEKSLSHFIKITSGFEKLCSVCHKATRTQSVSPIPCFQCHHFIHKKCANIRNWDITNIHKHLLTCVRRVALIPYPRFHFSLLKTVMLLIFLIILVFLVNAAQQLFLCLITVTLNSLKLVN